MVVYVTGTVLAGLVAANNRRDPGAWVMASLLCSPMLALIGLAALGRSTEDAASSDDQGRS